MATATNVARDQKRTINDRSAETSWLVKRLLALAVGESVTYKELSLGIGRDVQARGRSALHSARHIIEREEDVLFAVIPNVGLKRADDPTVLHGEERNVRHVARNSRRTVRRLGRGCNRNKLPLEDRAQYDVTIATSAMIAGALKPSVRKRLYAKVTADMPVPQLLEALKDAI